MEYRGGFVSIHAQGVSLLGLLDRLSKLSEIEISVSKGFSLEKLPLVNVDIEEADLESALKRVLKGFNYVLLYKREGGRWKITHLKLFSKDGKDQELIRLSDIVNRVSEQRYVEIDKDTEKLVYVSFDGQEYQYPLHRGIGVPGYSVLKEDILSEPLSIISLKKSLEKSDQKRYLRLKLLQKKIASVSDPEKRKALSYQYAEEALKIINNKRSNINKIEGIKRFQLLRSMKEGLR